MPSIHVGAEFIVGLMRANDRIQKVCFPKTMIRLEVRDSTT